MFQNEGVPRLTLVEILLPHYLQTPLHCLTLMLHPLHHDPHPHPHYHCPLHHRHLSLQPKK